MAVRTPIEGLASIENGGDVIDYLLDSEGLNYGSFVGIPSGIKQNQGRHEWYEAHLVDADNGGVIRYIELEASEESPSFSDLKRHLKRHGSPINELFTVVAYRDADEGPLTSPLNGDLTFLYIEEQFSSEDVEVTFDLKYFTVERPGVEPAYIGFLESLSVGSGQGRTSLEGDIEDVFSIRELTRSFYEELGEIFRETLQDAIHELEAPGENLSAYTRTVVNRVLFLLFIEKKGWLDGDVDYVENKYEAAKSHRDMHVYDDFFEPLFFEALSDSEDDEYGFLGRIPFLNGDLFERRDIEEEVSIDEEFFDALLAPEENESGGPRGFLRRYKISLRESSPSEQELAVDPEFIGRIFEMFMQEDERSEVGAFYTPKPITSYMAKNALKQHLLQITGITHEQAVSLVTDHTAPDALSEAQIENIDQSLRSASVLDPAVGSGAFVIAMLEEMVAIAEAIDEARAEERTRFRLKGEFIADNLYGIDIDPGGIELCKFRVWLHLMQDLEVTHEEFMEMNDEFALPNLGFKFFVGNSLVGEHDPTRIDVGSYQGTLTGGLDATLDEIHTTRKEYQTTSGAGKKRLGERLGELTTELETQLAVKDEGDWMADVASEAGTTFAWTSNIPEIILNGGFDIVIGNPPYEGQSQQDYVGELARFYDDKYDFYKTIPRMRHDLYQKFIIRGWELTRESGVLSYITSDTFYTIGSKQTTRKLLQKNKLVDLLDANPRTFDAAVEPAIFTLQKEEKTSDYTFALVDASETEIDQYRSLVGELIKVSGKAPEKGVSQMDLPTPTEGYAVPVSLYRNTFRSAFFKPTDGNLYLRDRFLIDIKELSDKWESVIQDATNVEDNLPRINRDHIQGLSPGDPSIMGLLTRGGQGLSTGDNAEYVAYLEGTRGARKIRERNGDDFEYVRRNPEGFGRSRLCRVISEDHVADVDALADEEKQHGIKEEADGVWVPIEKGFASDDTYYKDSDQYIDWSRDSVNRIDETGYIRNREIFFREGVYAVLGGFADLRVRYSDGRIIENGNLFFPHTDKVSAEYLTGIINSNVCEHIFETFINSEGVSTQNIRLIPVKVPTDEEKKAVERLVEDAIAIRKREKEGGIEEVQSKIDETVAEIYGVDLESLSGDEYVGAANLPH